MIGFVVNYFSVISILTGSSIEQVQLSKHLETMERYSLHLEQIMLCIELDKLMDKFEVNCPTGQFRLHVSLWMFCDLMSKQTQRTGAKQYSMQLHNSNSSPINFIAPDNPKQQKYPPFYKKIHKFHFENKKGLLKWL